LERRISWNQGRRGKEEGARHQERNVLQGEKGITKESNGGKFEKRGKNVKMELDILQKKKDV